MTEETPSYNIEKAAEHIGKRVIVSLRHIDSVGMESISGLWGVVEHVDEGGLLLKVEGGIEDEYWMIPPDLQALQPAQNEFYEFMNGSIIHDVDLEARFITGDSIEDLDGRER